MLLLQVASLVIGISLLAPIEARLVGGNSDFFGAGKYVNCNIMVAISCTYGIHHQSLHVVAVRAYSPHV